MAKQPRQSDAAIWQWRESRTVKRQDELRLGDHVEATLRWESPFSYLAYARAPRGQWTFDRPRLLSRDVEISQANSTAGVDDWSPVAVYREKWIGGGTLEFTDGHAYEWAPTNFWQTRWAFFRADSSHAADDVPVVAFDDTSGLFEHREEVTFGGADLSKTELGLLATLGHYLMELWRRDTAAVVAATTAAFA